MAVKEFWELGYLQEVNRRLLHPCGLALSVAIDENDNVTFGDIWDSRDDEEGFIYGDEMDIEKARRVTEEYNRHILARSILFKGSIVQPILIEKD